MNSSKSNRLPQWDPFFAMFAENQYLMYRLIHERPGLHKRFEACYRDNLHSIWAMRELYREGNSKDRFCGILQENMKPVYVPLNPHEKAMQRALLQFRRPQNFPLVREALRLCHREDLIGTGRNCLVPPEGVKTAHEYAQIRREKKEREARRAERQGRAPKPPRSSASRSATTAGKGKTSASRKAPASAQRLSAPSAHAKAPGNAPVRNRGKGSRQH